MESFEVRSVRRLLKAAHLAIRREQAALKQMLVVEEALQEILDALLDGDPAEKRAATRLVRVLSDKRPRTGEAAEEEMRKKQEARLGIGRIRVVRQANGRGLATIEDFVELSLPAKLADLLELLIAVREIDAEGFPVFLPYASVGATLGIASKPGAVRNGAVIQLVHRLRNEFESAHLNRFFIETESRRGVRLLIRRRPAARETTLEVVQRAVACDASR